MVIQVRRGNHLAERWRAKSNLAMCWLPYGAYTNDFLRTQCNAGVGEARQAGGRQGTARGVRQSKAGGDSQGKARVRSAGKVATADNSETHTALLCNQPRRRHMFRGG